jgi:hypothetical protein
MLVKYKKNDDLFVIEPGAPDEGSFMITYSDAVELRNELDAVLKMLGNGVKSLQKKGKKAKR